MTLKEFLEYREHRFNDVDPSEFGELYQGYAEGWTDAIKEIRMVLERHGFNMEIPLE